MHNVFLYKEMGKLLLNIVPDWIDRLGFCKMMKRNKVRGPHVISLLKWTLTFGWYMARFIVTNGHQKTMRLDYVLKTYYPFYFWRLTQLGGSMWSFEKKGNLQFDLLKLLYLKSDSETWNYNIHWHIAIANWMRQFPTQSNPVHWSKLSVELAVPTTEPHTLTSEGEKESCPKFVVQCE